MYLGIFGPGPNPSACFIENGNILFWAEEESFTRIKTSPFSFPTNAIKQGLKFLNKNPCLGSFVIVTYVIIYSVPGISFF